MTGHGRVRNGLMWHQAGLLFVSACHGFSTKKNWTKNICLLASCPAEVPFICGFMQISLLSSTASSSLLIRLSTSRSYVAYENMFTLQLSLSGIDGLQLCFASHEVLNQFFGILEKFTLAVPSLSAFNICLWYLSLIFYLHLVFVFSVVCAGGCASIILLKDKHS